MMNKSASTNVATVPVSQPVGARVFVWSVWLVMLLVALACIVKYGRNIPLAEDWNLVAPLTGNEPDLLGWLWAQNNEHRVPFPRLVLLGLLKMTGDFRVGMFFNALALGMLAAVAILVARHLRGGTDYADAFFPILLLHIGNWENLVWSWQLSFVLPIVLVCLVFLVMITRPILATPGAAIFTGVSLMLLPLCGAIGLIFIPFLAPWLIYCGVRNRRSPDGRFLIACAAIALCLVGLYFVGYNRPDWNPPSPGIGATLKTAAKFVAFGFGPVAAKSWALFVMLTFGILVPSGAVAVLGTIRHRGWERHRALGVLLFCSILAVFALAIGHGRAGLVPTVGLPMRYVLLAAIAFFTAFFVWELYGHPRWKTTVQRGLLLMMCLLLPLNTLAGFGWRDWYVQGMKAVEQDLLAGTPRSILAEQHRDFLVHWWDENKLAEHMQMLHDAEIGLFVQIQGRSVGSAD